jgi:hypothetical protein
MWRKARRITNSAKIELPEMEVHIWELEGSSQIGVIEKRKQGAFLDFHVENRPFGVVKRTFDRKAAKYSKGEQK